MSTRELAKRSELFPTFFDDFFRPFNDWVGMGKSITTPAVNIAENKNHFEVTVAAPGLKKSDFNLDIEGNMLTISCEKEERKEVKDEKDEHYTRKEYNYSSFSRSFTLPNEVVKEKIEATYVDGVLHITLPKTEVAKKAALSQHIAVK